MSGEETKKELTDVHESKTFQKSKTTKIEFDYVILRTGYTYRLLFKNRLAELIEEMQLKNYNHENYKIMFIKDELHDSENFIWDSELLLKDNKEILADIGGDSEKTFVEEKDKIEAINREINDDGYLCVKTNSFDVVIKLGECLSDLQYCSIFGILRMNLVDIPDVGKVLFIRYDSESG